MAQKNYGKKLLLVVLGSTVMGIGIYLTIIANFGSDPLTMFWIGLSNRLGIRIGQANLLVSALMLIVVFFMDRKEIFIGSILNPLVISVTTDFLLRQTITIDSVGLRMMFFILGLLILAFGIAVYSLADFGRGAYEALVFSLNQLFKRSIRIFRILCDISFAIAGILLGAQLSIGPVMAILLMGVSIQFFINHLSRPIYHYLNK